MSVRKSLALVAAWALAVGGGISGAMVFASAPPSASVPGREIVQENPREPAPDGEGVKIPPGWKSHYPFSARFQGPENVGPGDLVIDLKAIRFSTAGLSARAETGERRFLMPDLASFAPDLRTAAQEGSYRYVILQAATPEDQLELRACLKASGAAILDYLPNMAYLVRVPGAQMRSVFASTGLFWAGDFVPAFRIDPIVDYAIESSPDHRMRLRVLLDKALYPDAVSAGRTATTSGGTVLSVDTGEEEWIVRLEGPARIARQLAKVPGCLWVERYLPFELLNNVARTSSSVDTGRGSQAGPIMDVEKVWAKGIHGEGQIAAASDTGLSTGNLATLHQDFGNQADPNNPMRVRTAWALGRSRTGDWSDNGDIGGGHGTHTSGSIVGNGFRSGSTPGSDAYPSTCYAGVAPKAQYDFQSVMDRTGALGGIPADLNALFQPPYDDGARVHSNSWGAATSGAYDTDAQNLDKFTWNNKDMVITFSAGNSGIDSNGDGIVDADSIGSPGTAKNCITVGASESYRPDFQFGYGTTTEICEPSPTWGWGWPSDFPTDPVYGDAMADNANGMGAFSSRGPCNDGRIKPDIVAPGIAIISTRTDMNPDPLEQWGDCNLSSDLKPYYLSMGGTSMANPLTAGSAVLARQYYVDGWHPNGSQTTGVSPDPSYGFDPSSALVKATLINGAWDMAPGQYGTGGTKEIPPAWDTGHDLPNNVEGYGRVDLMHSLFPGQGWGDDPGRRMEVHDVTPGLQTGQYDSYGVQVGSSANPLVVTLVWTDPYGATSAGTELVNNLDLIVIAPGDTIYYPNGLNKTSGADNKNNVEQVKVTSPAAGAWSIRVNGTAVPGNSVSGSTTQPYALVISGVLAPPCAPPGVPTIAGVSAPADNVLRVSWTAGTGAGTSYKVYRAPGDCPGSGYVLLGSTADTLYDDATVSGGATYAYKVSAVDSTGGCESALSDCAQGTATGTCSQPPTFAGLASVTPVSGATCSLQLAWSAGTSNCGGTVTYNVYRSAGSAPVPPAGLFQSGLSATTYTDASVSSGTSYTYIVQAVDSANGLNDGNSIAKSGTPGMATTVTLYSNDFESATGLSDWSRFAFSGSSTDWRGIQQCTAHSGNQIFRYGGSDCPVKYSNGNDAGAIPNGANGGLNVPAGVTSVRLSFWHRWNYQSGYDGGSLWIAIGASTTYTLVPASAILAGTYNGTASGYESWTGQQGTFIQTTVDLDAACNAITGHAGGAAGQVVKVAFDSYTDSSTKDYGWFLDDITVTYQIPGACTSCVAPSSLANNTAADLDACAASGVQVTWSQDPGDWGDGGSGTRSYDLLVDGSAARSGIAYPSTSATYTPADGAPHAYAVRYNNGCGLNATSAGASAADVNNPAIPTITGGSSNACPATSVPLSTEAAMSGYQWYQDGSPVAGASSATYTATQTGSYTVSYTNGSGCSGTSAPFAVTIAPCTAPEVSPPSDPAHHLVVIKNGSGVDLQFQEVASSNYNVYVSTSPNTHPFAVASSSTGKKDCAATTTSIAGGMLQVTGYAVESGITATASVYYILVTADNGPATEGPLGSDSQLVERTADGYCNR